MIKGLYTATSAMISGLDRQQILAHNAANIETPGFKQILTSLDDYLYTTVYSTTNQNSYIGNLGLGVLTTPQVTDFTSGGIQYTENPFDLAISGNGFFRIQTPDGERYTRDGRFSRNAEGELVTVDGYNVLDENGNTIILDSNDFTVATDGTYFDNGVSTGKIGIVNFEDPALSLSRDVSNLYKADANPDTEVECTIKQSYLEMSNVNTADLMTQMMMVSRFYEAAQMMVSTQDELLGKAISTLGRI